jgi:hypothetical protein
MMGGSHRHTSTLRQRKRGAVGRLHSTRSRYRTCPRQKGGAHRQASSPGQSRLLAAATPHGAASGLARDGGRRALTSFPRVPVVATPCEAAPGLARDGGGAHRHASMPVREVPVAATPYRAATGLARKVGGADRHWQHTLSPRIL